MLERRTMVFRVMFLVLDMLAWTLAFLISWWVRQSAYFAADGGIAPLLDYVPFLGLTLAALGMVTLAGVRVRRGVAVLDEVGDVVRGTGAVFIVLFAVLYGTVGQGRPSADEGDPLPQQ